MHRFASSADIIGIFDVDEYVFPCQDENNLTVLEVLIDQFNELKKTPYPHIQMDCLRFGTSGYVAQTTNELIIPTRTRRAPYVFLNESRKGVIEHCKKNLCATMV